MQACLLLPLQFYIPRIPWVLLKSGRSPKRMFHHLDSKRRKLTNLRATELVLMKCTTEMANYGLVCLQIGRRLTICIELSSASSDETVQIIEHPILTHTTNTSKPIHPITHPKPVKTILPIALTPLSEPYLLTGSGDIIRVYDISSPHEPELLNEVDAHWHDVTALRLWMRRSAVEGQAGKVKVEPWIISTSLDGTIRKWNLLGAALSYFRVCYWLTFAPYSSRVTPATTPETRRSKT